MLAEHKKKYRNKKKKKIGNILKSNFLTQIFIFMFEIMG